MLLIHNFLNQINLKIQKKIQLGQMKFLKILVVRVCARKHAWIFPKPQIGGLRADGKNPCTWRSS